MRRNSIGGSALFLAASLLGVEAHAVPLGLLDQDGGFVDLVGTTVTSGATLVTGRGAGTLHDGTPIALFPFDRLANKEYSGLSGQLGNVDDNFESYVEFPGLLGPPMFASGYADAAANLEVGVDGFSYFGVAAARMTLEIKNMRSSAVGLNFALNFLPGQILTYDPAIYFANDPRAVHTRVEAMVDAQLFTPAGEFGGTYDVTDHHLFDFHVDMLGAGRNTCLAGSNMICAGKELDVAGSGELPVLHTYQDPLGNSVFGFDIDGFSTLVQLPEIAPFGSIKVFYDMYSLVNGAQERGGRASLGDPLNLDFGPGITFIERTPVVGPGTPPGPTSVPEPGIPFLAGFGLLLFGMMRRRVGR